VNKVNWRNENNTVLVTTLAKCIGPTKAGFMLGITRGSVAGALSRAGLSSKILVLEPAEAAATVIALEVRHLVDEKGFAIDSLLEDATKVERLITEARFEKTTNTFVKGQPIAAVPLVERIEPVFESFAEDENSVVPAHLLKNWPNAVSFVDARMVSSNGRMVNHCRTPLWGLRPDSTNKAFSYDFNAQDVERFVCGNPTANETKMSCPTCSKVLNVPAQSRVRPRTYALWPEKQLVAA
jgi:hypothetical protein